MRISYDAEVDALYIELVEGTHECRNVRLTDEVSFNMAEGERLVGIEVLDAKRILASGGMPRVIVDNLPVVAAA